MRGDVMADKVIKVSLETYKKLSDIKNMLTKKRNKSCSFEDAVSFLLQFYEKCKESRDFKVISELKRLLEKYKEV